MRLFESFHIEKEEESEKQYLRFARYCKPIWTREVSEAWNDEDMRIAILMLENLPTKEAEKSYIVRRWWWFGWHEEKKHLLNRG